MIIRSALFVPLVALVFSALVPALSRAAVDVTFEQVGGDVVVKYFGSINTASLTSTPDQYYGTYAAMSPAFGAVAALRGSYVNWTAAFSGPSGFGSSGSPFAATSNPATNKTFGFEVVNNYVSLSNTYVSGAAINGTFTYANTTLADLSLINGTQYSWNWSTGGVSDSITVTVGTAAVPEPGTFALLGIGAVAGLVALRKRSARRWSGYIPSMKRGLKTGRLFICSRNEG
jgi:hypothetical protein